MLDPNSLVTFRAANSNRSDHRAGCGPGCGLVIIVIFVMTIVRIVWP